MQIADLFDAHTRDLAVQELPDADLLVASVMIAQQKAADSLQRDWRGMDIAWLAMNARSEATAVAITRTGLTVDLAAGLFKAFLRVTHHRPPVMSHSARLRLTDMRAHEAAHIAQQRHGRAVLAELGRHEARRMVGYALQSNIGFVQEMLPYIEDVEVLQRITECDRLISQKLVVARIWELGARDIVASIANEDDDAMFSKKAARKAALEILGVTQSA